MCHRLKRFALHLSTHPSQNDNFKVLDSLMPDANNFDPQGYRVVVCSDDQIFDATSQCPISFLLPLKHFLCQLGLHTSVDTAFRLVIPSFKTSFGTFDPAS